jgi:hypothetical protein
VRDCNACSMQSISPNSVECTLPLSLPVAPTHSPSPSLSQLRTRELSQSLSNEVRDVHDELDEPADKDAKESGDRREEESVMRWSWPLWVEGAVVVAREAEDVVVEVAAGTEGE